MRKILPLMVLVLFLISIIPAAIAVTEKTAKPVAVQEQTKEKERGVNGYFIFI